MLERFTLKRILVFRRCCWFALSNHLSDSTLVSKTFFNFSTSFVVDLLKLSLDPTLLLKQTLDVPDSTF